MIEVRLFATLRENREKVLELDAAAYTDAQSLLDGLGIGPGDVSILLINGRHSATSAPVKDGDVLALFPPVGGG